MTRSRSYLVALLATAAGLLSASPAQAGSWQNNFAFGATLNGDLYTPTKLASPPAIMVVIHMCTGHSTTVHGWFDSYADTNGFYLIAPDAGKQCFDASAARSGDKAAVVTMVNYLITNKGADKFRVFAAGMSSGGCMTNTLLAVYPDVFAGGSAMPGFPAGVWPAGDTTCTKCSSTPPNDTAAQWAAMATNVFKWSGQYGCSQQWAGGGDQYNFNSYMPDVALQWEGLAGLGSGMSEASWSDHPGWTRTVYKDSSGNVRMETNLGPSGQKHDLESIMNSGTGSSTLYADVISYLGLDKASGACGLSTTSTTGGGGSNGTGGSGAGGSSGTGGATGTGGTTGTGGAGGHATGGSGATGTGGAGGHATGGSGATGTGGESTTGTGGTGTTGTGGTSATGTGGTSATGTGGSHVTGTGGESTTGAGGTSATGTGGTSATTGAGGSSPGTGGEATTGTGGDTGGDGTTGCSCALPGSGGAGAATLFTLLAFAGSLRRRRRR